LAKHRGRQVETEKMLATIFLAHSNAGPCQQHGASREDKSFQRKSARLAYLGSMGAHCQPISSAR
jgi:hypothetical protein